MKKHRTGNLRTPTDGKPYYCSACSADYYTWLACRNSCALEDTAKAEK